MAQQSIDQIRSQVNRDVLTHWLGLKACRNGVPERDDLDPLDLHQTLLHHIFLTKVEPDPFSVLIMLQGEYITDRAGQSLIGCKINQDSFGDAWESIIEVYHRVYTGRHPICTREKQMGANGWLIEAEVIHLPLLGNDGDVRYIYGSLDRIDLAAQPNELVGSSEQWDVTNEIVFDF